MQLRGRGLNVVLKPSVSECQVSSAESPIIASSAPEEEGVQQPVHLNGDRLSALRTDEPRFASASPRSTRLRGGRRPIRRVQLRAARVLSDP